MNTRWLVVLALAACQKEAGKPAQIAVASDAAPVPPPVPVPVQPPVPDPVPADTVPLEFHVVDSGSVFMQTQYARLQTAAPEGINGEVDVWRDAAGTRRNDYYLHATDRAVLEKYVATLDVPKDRRVAYERAPKAWRTHFIEADAPVDAKSVAKVELVEDPTAHFPVVKIELSADGNTKLAALTQKIAGKKMAITFAGQVLIAPIINGPINVGKMSIPFRNGEPVEQQRLAKLLFSSLSKPSP